MIPLYTSVIFPHLVSLFKKCYDILEVEKVQRGVRKGTKSWVT